MIGCMTYGVRVFVANVFAYIVCMHGANAQVTRLATATDPDPTHMVEPGNIGDVAANLTYQFEDFHLLIVMVAYVSGFGFAIAAFFKLKQHKDSPQQVPLGGGIALLIVSILLVFMPALIAPTKETVYGVS